MGFGLMFAKACKLLMLLVPKDKKLILFSAWFGKRYCENSMYEFEYCLKNSHFKCFWYAKDKRLYKDLKNKGIPVVYANSLKGVWYQVRAKMLVSAVQFSDFNQFLLAGCIYLDLDHGYPGKPVTLDITDKYSASTKWYYQCRSHVDFYKIMASKFSKNILSEQLDVDSNHCIFCNMPRVDVLFDLELQKGKNTQISEIKKNNKIISYLPTHRSSGKKKMDMNNILDLKSIQEICEKQNAFFVIKKHFYHKNEIDNIVFPNIIDITHENIDTQVLLAQTDILVTDFSSCFVDYLPTDRPIIFFAKDYDEYMAKERDYYWKYDLIHAGYTTKTTEDFLSALAAVTTDWKDSSHTDGRKEMREVYFDPEVEMGTTREKLMGIMEQLIEGTYVPYDWSKKR